MKLKVDYHFHPNLPFGHLAAVKKVKSIYQQCLKLGINALLITEHSYKNPARAFKYMRRFLPHDFFIFPGLEYITKDKIDLIIFSCETDIYAYQELKSFQLNYEDVVDFVMSHDDLEAFVTHPFTLAGTGLVKRKGMYFTKKMIDKLGAVEMDYGVFAPLKSVANRNLLTRKLFKRSLYRINLNEDLPGEFYPRELKFLAAGSDAHHVKQLGSHCELAVREGASKEDVFRAIISNTSPKVVHAGEAMSLLLIRSGMTSVGEYFCKQRTRLGGGLKRGALLLKSRLLAGRNK